MSKKFARVLFVAPMTNFSSWKITMPLYNSSEVFVPAKQYGNTIHSDSLDIKNRYAMRTGVYCESSGNGAK